MISQWFIRKTCPILGYSQATTCAFAVVILRLLNHNVLDRSQLLLPFKQSRKELRAGKEIEGQRQLLMFGSRNLEMNTFMHPDSQIYQLHILLLWQKFDMMNILVKIHNIQLIISIGYRSACNNVYLWTKNLTLYVHIKTTEQRTIIQHYVDGICDLRYAAP